MARSRLARLRSLSIAGFVIACLVLGFLAATTLMKHQRGAAASAIGGPFALSTGDGRTVTDRDMKGRPFLVFFGYTHCPDVCPTTLADLSAIYRELGPDASKINALFVSVDPERDHGATMKDYMSSFDPHIIGLTGSTEQTKEIEREFRVYAKKVYEKDGSYTMDHVSIVYLMDKDGRFDTVFDASRPPKDAANDLRRYF